MLSVEAILESMLKISSNASGTGPLISGFAAQLKDSLKMDEARSVGLDLKGGKPNVAEAFALNTGKPYLDNSLSGYSAFPELINYFNNGFRSCLLIPVKSDTKNFGAITLLSRSEAFFKEDEVATITFLSGLVGRECETVSERDRRIALSQYFDASFESAAPQCVVDRQGTIIRANKSLVGMLGLGSKQLEDEKLSRFLEFKPSLLEKLDGSPMEVLDKNGRRFSIRPKKINEDLFHLLINDISEISILRNRQDFFEYGTEEAFLLLDPSFKIYWASPNMRRAFRADPEYFIGKKLTDLVKNREVLSGLNAITSRQPPTYEIDIKLDNEITINAKATIVRDEAGFAVILSKNNERYLNNMRHGVEDLMRVSSDMVIILDSLGYVRNANRSAEKILHYKVEELNGLSISSLCADAESQLRIGNGLNIAKSSGTVTDIFVNWNAKGAPNPLPAQQNIRPIYDETNRLSGYMLVGKELATKNMIARLEELSLNNEKLVRKYKEDSERKTDFINSISHDLKTPITSISGFAKLMLEDDSLASLNDEQKNTLNIIIAESNRLTQLIERILDVAKLEANKIKLDRQPVNLNELSQNAAIKSLQAAAENKGLYFRFVVEYDVPVIEADPNRLIQVFVNLAGNSIKFTERGGVTVHVTRNGKKSKQIRIAVKDTGVGISREDKARLFKKFFQINKDEALKRGGSGTGLGLTIAKEIVKLHGGKIGIESDGLGKGSEFWFTLPVTAPQKKKSEAVPEAKAV